MKCTTSGCRLPKGRQIPTEGSFKIIQGGGSAPSTEVHQRCFIACSFLHSLCSVHPEAPCRPSYTCTSTSSIFQKANFDRGKKFFAESSFWVYPWRNLNYPHLQHGEGFPGRLPGSYLSWHNWRLTFRYRKMRVCVCVWVREVLFFVVEKRHPDLPHCTDLEQYGIPEHRWKTLTTVDSWPRHLTRLLDRQRITS